MEREVLLAVPQAANQYIWLLTVVAVTGALSAGFAILLAVQGRTLPPSRNARIAATYAILREPSTHPAIKWAAYVGIAAFFICVIAVFILVGVLDFVYRPREA